MHDKKVKMLTKGVYSFNMNWKTHVEKPFKASYYNEAFASMDSLIDEELKHLLRQIYNSGEAQDLLNEIEYLRGAVNFDGLQVARILESKTVITGKLVEKIREFKKARNLVLHETSSEYALVFLNPKYTELKTDEELEKIVLVEASNVKKLADNIYVELRTAGIDLRKKRAKYFHSNDFFEKNPRIKQIKKRFPNYETLLK